MKRLMMGFAIAGLVGFASVSMANDNSFEEAFFQDKSKDDTPVFSTPEANKGVAEFKTLMDEYGPFLAKNDSAKTMEFGQKMQTWSTGVQTWMAKLSPEEQQKLGTYLEAYSRKYMPSEPTAPSDVAPAKVTD